jgi:hypothetical protein
MIVSGAAVSCPIRMKERSPFFIYALVSVCPKEVALCL